MPRPAKQKHPLRDLRKIIGGEEEVTQCGFAHSLGISSSWLKQIENNVVDLSPRTARRVRLATGVDDKKLLRGELRDVWGDQYTAKSYAAWKGVFTAAGEKTAREHAKYIYCWIDVLFRAAVLGSKRGQWPWRHRRLWQVEESLLEALEDAITQAQKNFNLSRKVRAILRKYGESNWTPAWHPEGRDVPPKLLRELFPAESTKTQEQQSSPRRPPV